MPFSVVVGAGPVGCTTARLVAGSGQDVRLVSRSGRGPRHDRIETVAVDAADTAGLTELTLGATTLFNCAMPRYDRWPAEFPPLAASLLSAAERTGADYVLLGNTYGYGPVDVPMTEDLPMAPTTVKGKVRARMWTDALMAHEEGRVRAVEVRSSEYLGAGAASAYTLMVVPAVLAGAEAAYPGDLDARKSWNHVGDVARTLVAASRQASGTDWGRAWHVPPTATLSVRDLTRRLAHLAGVADPVLTAMSFEELRKLGETDTVIAEIVEMYYVNDRPHILDPATTRTRLGVGATPIDEVLRETITGGSEGAR
ncbi:NAD-dependent epimerase/dehydratase family protein [Amycolatopsis sp. CA-230715]|uniref:NAD-dependent epimerase/dehydratase family protein n=1 Tax=Amycolatopsis sp. CA-230715 TaxID=2745196 RepID=UPI001C036F9F|nr:NAD-dependent epimerase/dehydratase family protein [Amycolatopsis sp. CA-230715]QWF77762.1 hypothetical protein HUW46_01154 [Amycolatopsis sp. CA-230715]